MMCRVPIAALSRAQDLSRPLQPLEYVGLSSGNTARPLIAPHQAADPRGIIQPLLRALSHAEKVKEVLVAWCGRMPRHLFEVIDVNTGEFIRMLEEKVPLLASSHGSADICEGNKSTVQKTHDALWGHLPAFDMSALF